MQHKATKWLWLPVLLLITVGGIAMVMLSRRSDQPQSAAALSNSDKPLAVGCRGRIEPEDGVILIAAPYFSGRPSVISELRVKEGDTVKAGQVIAALDGRYSLETALRENEAEVEVARKKLDQLKAGAKPADIDAQRMEVARWEIEYEIADNDYRRYKGLQDSQIVSVSELDQKKLILDRNKRTLDAAKERLKSLEEVRKEDVDVLAAQLQAAIAQVEHARADLDRMIVRAPKNGKVLKVRAHAGEEAGPQGILELGKTDRMYVVAEVYESDINRIRIGQKATISGDLVSEELTGTVTEIGSQVTKTELLPLDPAAFADTRVVKVKIQIQNGERIAGLIYGKVNVVIYP
jgi:HlyD family secretion protein